MTAESLAESYCRYVRSTPLEELRECWEAADDNTRGGLDASFCAVRPDEFTYWWFYRQRKTLENKLSEADLSAAIVACPDAWRDYRAGKDAAIGRLMGFLVKKGFAPDVVRAALADRRANA